MTYVTQRVTPALLTNEDFESLRGLARQIYEDPAIRIHKSILRAVMEENHLFVVRVDDTSGMILGMVLLSTYGAIGGEVGVIQEMSINEGHAGFRLSTLLLEEAIAYARQHTDISRLDLTMPVTRLSSKDVLRSYGFEARPGTAYSLSLV